jgi:hypothetical protein
VVRLVSLLRAPRPPGPPCREDLLLRLKRARRRWRRPEEHLHRNTLLDIARRDGLVDAAEAAVADLAEQAEAGDRSGFSLKE